MFVKQSPRAQEARAEDKSTSPQGIFQAVKTNSAERPVMGMLLSLVMSLQSHLYLRLCACGSQIRPPVVSCRCDRAFGVGLKLSVARVSHLGKGPHSRHILEANGTFLIATSI